MVDEIINRYTLDISNFVANARLAEKQLLTTEQSNQSAIKKTSDVFTEASKKRLDAIEKEKANYSRLQGELKKAFDPETIRAFNILLKESQRNIELLGGSVKSVSANTKNFLKGLREDIGAQNAKFAQMRSTALSLGAALGVAFGAQQLIQFGREAINVALRLEGIANAFAKLNKPGLLDELRTATRGTVTDLDLMRNAVQANNFQIPLEGLATLFKFASIRARETGESVDFLVQSIVNGIARKSPLILDNLGINVKRIRDEFTKTGDFAKAAFIVVNQELSKTGEFTGGAADTADRLKVAYNDVQVAVGQGLIGALEGLALVVDGLTGDYFDLIDTVDHSEAIYKNNAVAAIELANSFAELDDATRDYVVSNSLLNETFDETFQRLKTQNALFKELTKSFSIAVKQIQLARIDAVGDFVGNRAEIEDELKKSLKKELDLEKQKSVRSLENLKLELDGLKAELDKQEIGSELFNSTRDKIIRLEAEIAAATGEGAKKELDARKKGIDSLIQLYNDLANVRIALIENEHDRAIAEVEQELKERLEKIKGGSQVENDLRVAYRLKAEQDIQKINDDFLKKEIDAKVKQIGELKRLAILGAEDLGNETLSIQREFLIQERDQKLQDVTLTENERKLIIAETDRELGELSIQQLKEDSERYRLNEEYKTKLDEEAAERKRLIHEQTQQALFELSQIGIQLAQELNDSNLQNDLDALDLRSETELGKLQELLDKKLISEEDYNARKAAAENKYEIQRKNAQREAARREKALRMFSIAVQTAENVVKALGVPPVPNFILSGIALAAGIAQEIAVASKPIPFNKGTKSVPGTDLGYDSVPAIVRPREKIFPVDTSLAYQPALDAIFDRKIHPRVMNAFANAHMQGKSFGENVDDAVVVAQYASGIDYKRMRRSFEGGNEEVVDVLYQIKDQLNNTSKLDMFKRRGIIN